MKSHLPILFLSAIVAFSACKGVPKGVLKPDRMAELMADVRMADAVVSMHPADYPNEVSRRALHDAVFDRHSVTQAQFDSSLVWYGHNIMEYQEMTDLTIKILEKRLEVLNTQAAGEMAMTLAGDSVDLWQEMPPMKIDIRSPSRFYTFMYEADPNWKPGDIYTLRGRLVTPAHDLRWNLTAWYDDGTVETITGQPNTHDFTRQEMTLVTDRESVPTRITGFINIEPNGHRPTIIDSLSLVRKHLAPEADPVPHQYQQRRYPLRSNALD